MEAFDKEDTKLARSVFKKDEILDEINLNANQAVSDFIRANTERINQSLYLLSTIRKLERVGDQCKNIAEEIIFYIEAKVLKHKTQAQKQAE
jgi:phosphate transport system protein